MIPWLVIVLAGLGSYLFRISMVVLAERITMPEKVQRASALVVPRPDSNRHFATLPCYHVTVGQTPVIQTG